MSYYNEKTGHPILGVILGLLGIAAAVLLAFITGVIGGGLAAILGLAALLLGIQALKGGRGIPAMLAGIVAIALAVIMTYSAISSVNLIKEKALQNEATPLVAKYADKPYLGILGIIINMPKDEGSIQELVDQINLLQ